MNLLKILKVSDNELKLVSDDVRLELYSPGRASFKVVSDMSLSGRVTLDIGYSHDKSLKRWFTGFVEKSIQVSKTEQLLFCRELSASLNRIVPLNLRHPTLEDIAIAISNKSGLAFNLPDQAYIKKKIPYFYHLSGGYHALDAIGEVFQIPNYIWQQQGNGEIYLGDWNHSFWSTRPVQIPENLLAGHQADEGADIQAVPGLRPGIYFNGRFFIQSVKLSGNTMRLTWSKQLKK